MILDDIVSHKKLELETAKLSIPLDLMKRKALTQAKPLDLADALRGDRVRLIAEVKQASPSRGLISEDFDPVEIAQIYAANGAAAISILTESRYFKGSLDHLRNIRLAVKDKLSLLRKDFIFDPYQVYESRAYGADAILLIAAILTQDEMKELLSLSHELGMNCLVEVHNKAELEIVLKSGAGIIGINNRDLTTFKVDTDTTLRLRSLIPWEKIVVSESGIKTRLDIEKMKKNSVNAVLIGEALMSSPDIAARMKELL